MIKLEEILLTLICEEFDVDESFIFSETRDDDKQDMLAMFVYIANVVHGKPIKGVYKFMVEKGYPKTRACLYNYLKRGRRRVEWNAHFRFAYNGIVQRLKSVLDTGLTREETTDERVKNETVGRLVTKIFKLSSKQCLLSVERHLDNCLKAELLKTEVVVDEE